MNSDYWTQASRLEQQFADAYHAYRKHIESTPYPSDEEEWAEHDRYRNAVSETSAAWGKYCPDNRPLR